MRKVLTAIALLCILQMTGKTSGNPHELDGMVKETYDFAVKDGDTLKLDVYYNPTVPYEGKRPIVIFSFGGGWEAGARADGGGSYTPFLNTMTRYGYVTVGIDYRLGYLKSRKTGKVKDISICASLIDREMDRNIYENVHAAIMDAVEDLYDATTYMVKNADKWNADADCIVIGGISAGGVNSITAENMLVNEDEMAKKHLPKGFRYAGVISGCGAIWHDFSKDLQWKSTPCPTMFIHGDADNIVPYKQWSWKEHNFKIEGGCQLASYYKEMEVPYMLVTGTGGSHNYGGYAFALSQDLIQYYIQHLVINKEKIMIEMVDTPITK